jgi:hypothetical protein
MIVAHGGLRQTGGRLSTNTDTPRGLRGCVRPRCDARGMTTTDLFRWCSTCATEAAFEQPDCRDGHGADCPELVCVLCGDALFVDLLPTSRARTARRGRVGQAVSHVA